VGASGAATTAFLERAVRYPVWLKAGFNLADRKKS
jgi:hypothetical protein